MPENDTEKFLNIEELFIAIGYLLRDVLKLEEELVIFTPEPEGNVENINKEFRDTLQEVDVYQDILDITAMLLSHIKNREDLLLQCNDYLAEHYGIELDIVALAEKKGARVHLRLVKS